MKKLVVLFSLFFLVSALISCKSGLKVLDNGEWISAKTSNGAVMFKDKEGYTLNGTYELIEADGYSDYTFKNGLREGEYICHDTSGNLIMLGIFHDGIRNDIWMGFGESEDLAIGKI